MQNFQELQQDFKICISVLLSNFCKQTKLDVTFHVYLMIFCQVLPDLLKGAILRLLCQSSSIGRATPKLKNVYYKDTKEKYQMIVSHMACFCRTGVIFEECNLNIFCLTNKTTIKTCDII